MHIPQSISKITEADLKALIAAAAKEDKTLEYKSNALLGDTAQKRKFVKTVASFANASGGDLVLGMHALDGVPTELQPLKDFNFDQDSLTFRDLLRNHLDPPVFGVEYQAVNVQNGVVVVVRVPRSWHRPHMVTFVEERRFYTRDGNGCVPMNVTEIRNNVLGVEGAASRLRDWRLDRLSSIRSGELPINLIQGATVVIHVLPFSAYDSTGQVDVGRVGDDDLRPLRHSLGWSITHDIDGVYGYEKMQDGQCTNYVYLAKSGCLEVLNREILSRHREGQIIPNSYFESESLRAVEAYLPVLEKLGVGFPMFVALSLLDVRNYTIYSGRISYLQPRPIAHRDLIIREVILEGGTVPIPEACKPIFDSLWNACGLPRSHNFDDNGRWKPQQWQ